jgi:hypothetical protein
VAAGGGCAKPGTARAGHGGAQHSPHAAVARPSWTATEMDELTLTLTPRFEPCNWVSARLIECPRTRHSMLELSYSLLAPSL